MKVPTLPQIVICALLAPLCTAKPAVQTVTKTVTTTRISTQAPSTVTKTVTKTVTSSSSVPAKCQPTSQITNGNFETGSLSSWGSTNSNQPAMNTTIEVRSPGSNNNKAGKASKYAAYFETTYTQQTQDESILLQKFYPCANAQFLVQFSYQFATNVTGNTRLAVQAYYEETQTILSYRAVTAAPGAAEDSSGNPIIKGTWYSNSFPINTESSNTYPTQLQIYSECNSFNTAGNTGSCGVAIDDVSVTFVQAN